MAPHWKCVCVHTCLYSPYIYLRIQLFSSHAVLRVFLRCRNCLCPSPCRCTTWFGRLVQKPSPDGYSLLHRATWRPGETATAALVYLLDYLDVDTRAVLPEKTKKKKKKKKKKGEGKRRIAPLGSTPLMEAASRGNEFAVRVLLDAGADINATDAEGRTALVRFCCVDSQLCS